MSDSMLEEANKTITTRADNYGGPLPNFLQIAIRWTLDAHDILQENTSFSLHHVVMMMQSLKLSRDAGVAPTRDNQLDIVGYAGCYDIIDQELKNLGYDGILDDKFKKCTLADLVEIKLKYELSSITEGS